MALNPSAPTSDDDIYRLVGDDEPANPRHGQTFAGDVPAVPSEARLTAQTIVSTPLSSGRPIPRRSLGRMAALPDPDSAATVSGYNSIN